jgi:hypothetical protein
MVKGYLPRANYMNRRTTIAFTAIAISVIVALSVWLALSYASVRSGAPLGTTTKDQQGEIRELPLYDGAMLIEVNDDDPGDYSSIHYEVDAEVAAVEDFYKGELPRLGWQLDALYHMRRGGDSVNLDWRALKLDDTVQINGSKLNESDDTPYDLSLTLFIEDNRNASGAVGRTAVELLLARVPILARVPVLPDATQVATNGPTTTYQTAATVDQVREFYTERLAQYGWYFEGEMEDFASGQKVPGSLLFTWWHGGIHSRGWSASVEITTEPLSEGKLNVTMKVSGATMLRP